VAEQQEPFADVVEVEDGFSIPSLKWRELLFVGALRAQDDHFVRDSARPMPPFRRGDLFPVGRRFRVEPRGDRVVVLPGS
jgi:hypothetical protein